MRKVEGMGEGTEEKRSTRVGNENENGNRTHLRDTSKGMVTTQREAREVGKAKTVVQVQRERKPWRQSLAERWASEMGRPKGPRTRGAVFQKPREMTMKASLRSETRSTARLTPTKGQGKMVRQQDSRRLGRMGLAL
jgi:hypothetical protein